MADGGRRQAELRVRAPAKINLYLEVLGRRPDGFHEVRTIIQAVSLFDELEFRVCGGGEVSLACAHPDLPTDERNLVVRAARLLQRRYGVSGGAAIALKKRIPVGGGLGGGSADAAVSLLALNRLWELDAPLEELAELAAELGSDVPYFLWGGAALCEGRGERVSPLPCARPMHYVLVTPPCSVSTGRAYEALEKTLTERTCAGNNVSEALLNGDAKLLGRCLRNDLEAAALGLCEDLRELRRKLEEARAACHAQGLLLSGSGSSFFMVVAGEREARRAADFLVSTLDVSCAPVCSLAAWDGRVTVLTVRRGLP